MRTLLKVIILPAIIFVLVFSYLSIPKLIRINSLSCQSQYGPCSPYFEELIQKAKGNSLKDARKILSGSLETEPTLKDFSIQFKLPNKLRVFLIEKKPKFALKNDVQNLFGLIEKDGLVIRMESQTNLPYVISPNPIPNVGERVSSKELFALGLVYELFSKYSVNKGKVENDSLLVEMPNGILVIFPQEGDKEVLLGAFTLIFERLNEPSQDSKIDVGIRVIDLRFKNPVLR